MIKDGWMGLKMDQVRWRWLSRKGWMGGRWRVLYVGDISLENFHPRKIWEDEVGGLLERGKEELVYGCVGDRWIFCKWESC